MSEPKTETRVSEDHNSEGLFTDEEIDFLTGLAEGYSRHGPLTSDDIDCVLRWAHATRVQATMLELVFAGKVVMTWDRNAKTVRCWSVEHVNRA